MVKRLLAVLVVSVSLIAGFTGLNAKNTDCEHYFKIEVINGRNYLVEYNCYDIIIMATVIDD